MTHARQRGFALLIVLWSVVLLALLGTQIAATGRTEAQLAANLRAAAVAEAAADGAVQAAAFHLLDPASGWAADGRARTLRVGAATVSVTVENEAGKVNPNTAEPELIRALLLVLGADRRTAERVADAIADWRFPGEQRRPNGAKAAEYRAAGLSYAPPGAPFADLDELGAVLGMTPALLARLRPFLTLLTDAPPEPAAAPPPVLEAIRAAYGPVRAVAAPAPPRAVTVVAVAQGDAGGRFTRIAGLRLGAAKDGAVRVMSWTSGS